MLAPNIVETENACIEMRSDGILLIAFKDGSKISQEVYRQLTSASNSFDVSGVLKVVVVLGDFIITEKNFWEICVKSELLFNIEMTAIVAPSLGKKILARNYLYKCKPKNQFGIFDDVDSAVLWLTPKE